MADKYIEIDGTTGEPDFIKKDKGQKIPGVPKDENLCHVAFRKIKIPKVGESPDGEPIQVDVPGYAFDCDPSPECKKKNEGAEDQKKRARNAITQQDNLIKQLESSLDALKDKKKLTDAEKAQKDGLEDRLKKARTTKKALETYLKAFSPYCGLKAAVGAGGDDKLPSSGRLSLDAIKAMKIQFLYCVCSKVNVPKPSKDTGLD